MMVKNGLDLLVRHVVKWICNIGYLMRVICTVNKPKSTLIWELPLFHLIWFVFPSIYYSRTIIGSWKETYFICYKTFLYRSAYYRIVKSLLGCGMFLFTSISTLIMQSFITPSKYKAITDIPSSRSSSESIDSIHI